MMDKKDNIKLEALSNIDDDIIEKTTAIRCSWLMNIGKKAKKSRIWLRVVSIAACICLIFGGGLFGILQFLGKQIPIYTGMTVQNTVPAVNQTAKADGALQIELLSDEKHDREIDQKDPYKKGEDGKKLHDSIDERFKDSIVSAKDEYFAKKNEDVYFVIHIENPDNFVILSFTLNGTVYSSYMFEEGSDMETLILKYNVGDVEGEQSYTIDAIKYVDGSAIKDVIMEGERTVNVKIYPEEQPTVAVIEETVNYLDVSFVATVDDPKELIAASDGKLYAMLYDGETLIQEKEISAGDTVTFENLLPDTLYQYALVAVYDAIDGEGKKAYVLYEKAFYTEKIVEIQTSKLWGFEVRFSANWSENYTGTKQFDSLALYEGETKIRDIDVNSTKVSNLPFDKELLLVATYTVDGQKFTIRCSIESPKSSKGLAISGGVVTGIGTCQDTALYINAPIASSAFSGNQYLKEIYLGEGATSIGYYAFGDCTSLTSVILDDSLTNIGVNAFIGCTGLEYNIYDNAEYLGNESNKYLCLINAKLSTRSIHESTKIIGEYAFKSCRELTSITIPNGVTNIGDSAFEACTGLISITIPNGVTKIGNRMFKDCMRLTSITIPDTVISIGDYAFDICSALKSVIIGNSVTSIGTNAFWGCMELESVTIPNSVTSIGTNAFYLCTNLTYNIYDKAKYLGNESNKYLYLIEADASTRSIHESTKIIGSHAFATRTGVTSIVIPDSVTNIGYDAFYNCTSLTSVTFENTTGWLRDGQSINVSDPSANARNLKNGDIWTRS